MSFHGLITILGVLLSCLPDVYCGHSVIYSSSTVCGLKGEPVVLPCKYEYSGHYLKGGWYKNGYNVRGHSDSKYPDCSMKIDKLKNYHPGVYYFQFYTTLHISWVTTESGVTLLVTDPPQVKEEDVVWNQNLTKLTCSTSCSLGSEYVWYRNGQQLQDKTTDSILVDSVRPSEEGTPEGYSCRVGRYRSPAVCVPAKQCWGVIYPSTNICALLGSSVDIPCTYTYPQDERIKTSFWFNKQTDLKLNEGYKTHIEYIQNKDNCSLRLKDIRESHSGEYGFKFTTEKGKVYTGWPGVTITVTTLQVSISRKAVTERERVTLTCNATCTLSNALTIVWYNNGQPVYNKHTTRNKLHLNPVSSEDAGSYSCAVKGHENLTSTVVFLSVRYAPKNVSVSIGFFDETEEGSSVTLTCSSDANPPVHNYTWYMKSGAESLVRGTGKSISFNVTSDTSGLYYCEAQNELGSQNSPEVRILEKDGKALVVTTQAMITLGVILVFILILSCIWLSMKRKSKLSMNPHALRVEDVHYTSIQFRQSAEPDELLHRNAQGFQLHKQEQEVVYSTVKLQSNTATWTDTDTLVYSTVNKVNRVVSD